MSFNVLKSLEETFGKIPEVIYENIKYLTYDDTNDEFVCEPCGNKIIKLVPENKHSTTINFVKHLQSNSHKDFSVNVNTLINKLNYTFPGNIPAVIKNNIEVLGLSGSTYECVICNKYLKEGSQMLTTENNFLCHLLAYKHENMLVKFRRNKDRLMDIYGSIPEFILNDSEFLIPTLSGKNYRCIICDELINVDPDDVANTEHNFENHFQCYKHKQQAKQKRIFHLLPELKQGPNYINYLPTYILRNLSYLSTNYCHGIRSFFCSLCQESIIFEPDDGYQMEENLKCHLLSQIHEENLSNRRDLDDDTFNKLHELFDEFPNDTVEQLKHLTLDGEDDEFCCNICEEFLNGEDDEETHENIINHFESDSHSDKIDEERDLTNEILEQLVDLFGETPDFIKENMFHIKFQGGNSFKCLLCDKVMQSKTNDEYETNVSVTKNNFWKHLDSNGHREELINLRQTDVELINDLEELCSPIPQYIMNNLKHIGYEEDSDNFYCYTCSTPIYLINGTQKEQLTLVNIRNHLFSLCHTTKVKEESNRQLVASNQLMSIFGSVPTFVLNNLRYMEQLDDDSFQCNLCDAEIQTGMHSNTTKNNFLKHLSGHRHVSNVREEEELHARAWKNFDDYFSRIPEFLLRDLDFLACEEQDFFCLLCQKKIEIDEEDLDFSKMILRSHMYSNHHRNQLIAT